MGTRPQCLVNLCSLFAGGVHPVRGGVDSHAAGLHIGASQNDDKKAAGAQAPAARNARS
jgi:hypothetical protein